MSGKRKYTAIAKVGTDDKGNNICVKYRFNHIGKFIDFCIAKHPGTKWINIFNKETKTLEYTFGIKKGLEQAK